MDKGEVYMRWERVRVGTFGCAREVSREFQGRFWSVAHPKIVETSILFQHSKVEGILHSALFGYGYV